LASRLWYPSWDLASLKWFAGRGEGRRNWFREFGLSYLTGRLAVCRGNSGRPDGRLWFDLHCWIARFRRIRNLFWFLSLGSECRWAPLTGSCRP